MPLIRTITGLRKSAVAIGLAMGLWAAVPSPATAQLTLSCHGVPATIQGTSAGEQLLGTSGDDVIQGAGGNDTIKGRGANDLICGGSGDDSVQGGPGADTLDGGSDNDTLLGGDGTDVADFSLATGSVSVSLATGTAAGQGSDTLQAIESVTGSDFGDLLHGDDHANTLVPGPGDDSVDGAGGNDTVDFGGTPGPVTVNLTTSSATGQGKDGLFNLENITGTGQDDNLTGNDMANVIRGAGGNDVINGVGGSDTLTGNAGLDSLAGGPGTDSGNGGAGTDSCLTETAASCEQAADQVNDPVASSSTGCPAGVGIYQGFIPTLTTLSKAELRFRTGGSFPANGVTLTLKLLSGGPDGPTLGTTTAFVPGPQVTGIQLLIDFRFSSAIAITPGQVYLLEWISTTAPVLTVMHRSDDPYPGGTEWDCVADPVAAEDLNFKTFA